MPRRQVSQKKEKASERKERRAANALAKQQFLKVGLPILIAIVVLIVGFVYLASSKKRPSHMH